VDAVDVVRDTAADFRLVPRLAFAGADMCADEQAAQRMDNMPLIDSACTNDNPTTTLSRSEK